MSPPRGDEKSRFHPNSPSIQKLPLGACFVNLSLPFFTLLRKMLHRFHMSENRGQTNRRVVCMIFVDKAGLDW